MENKTKESLLELRCDLRQAAKFYDVDIDDIEMKEYATPFSITQEHSSMSLSIACSGCNEQIKVDVIELPRINNLKSSSFVIQIGIILTLVLLPTININVNSLSIYVLATLGILFFLYELYSYFIRAPVRLDTLFFWHKIKKGQSNNQEVEPQARDAMLPETSD